VKKNFENHWFSLNLNPSGLWKGMTECLKAHKPNKKICVTD